MTRWPVAGSVHSEGSAACADIIRMAARVRNKRLRIAPPDGPSLRAGAVGVNFIQPSASQFRYRSLTSTTRSARTADSTCTRPLGQRTEISLALSTAMGSGRDGRLSKRWHRRSSTSPKVTAGALISIWRNSSIGSITTLMGQIAKRVEDKRLLKLIRAFLNAGVMENGLVSPSVEGTPQGGPLSPLLSNLMLDELDRELERRGHRFVRYADDCNIYVRSERAGQRVMESITQFITQKLKLKVNEAKSAVARPQERKFLGFSFTAGPEVKRAIAPKALDRFKQRIREITRRAKGVSMETTMEELAPYMRGWRSYFGFCETPEVLIGLTRWVRLRLRAAMWRQWKPPRRRRAALLELGVREPLASNTAGSGRGPWYLAKAKALSVGLSNAYFKSLGLPSLFEDC